MKTYLTWDAKNGRYSKKESQLHAIIYEGQTKKDLGNCTVDLADFAQPAQHKKQILLTNNLAYGVDPKSHIQLEVDTSIAKDGGHPNMRQS